MNLTRLLNLQIGVLALGSVFSWSVVIWQYARFLGAGCGLLQLAGCGPRNPLVTPCFYGAWAFLAAFVWSLVAARCRTDARPRLQRGLNRLLAFGAVFAWSNFGYELYRYATARGAPAFSCPVPGSESVNPFAAPCFSGALMFLFALLASFAILRKMRAAAGAQAAQAG